MMPTFSLGELAEKLGAEPVGLPPDGSPAISGLRSLAEAGAGELSFLHQAAYRDEAAASRAAALIVPQNLRQIAAGWGKPLLVVAHSPLAVAQALALFHPRPAAAPGVHPTAVVAEGVALGEGVAIGPYAVVGEGCTLGDRTRLAAHVVVGRGCTLGDDVVLHPGVVLYDGCELGDRVEIHAGSVIGADGFGYASVRGVHHKVPQVGRVVLGDDVEVGACTTIDRATLDATRIGAGTKIDNQVQVGHNVQTGKGCILCGQAGIAGSTKLGDYVVLAGQVGVSGHLELGTGVQAGAAAIVLQSVASGQVAGAPAVPIKEWRRQVAAQNRVGELLRRVKKLEKALGMSAPEPTSGES
jgi:UDP-3-O-[3-hydroxymyristoyl] glucosamine N-acyltransferase